MRVSISPEEFPLGYELLDALEGQGSVIYPRPGTSDQPLVNARQATRIVAVVQMAATRRNKTVQTWVHDEPGIPITVTIKS